MKKFIIFSLLVLSADSNSTERFDEEYVYGIAKNYAESCYRHRDIEKFPDKYMTQDTFIWIDSDMSKTFNMQDVSLELYKDWSMAYSEMLRQSKKVKCSSHLVSTKKNSVKDPTTIYVKLLERTDTTNIDGDTTIRRGVVEYWFTLIDEQVKVAAYIAKLERNHENLQKFETRTEGD